jgi:AbrB family looped-hinge helix DNA binding protein
MESKNFDNPMRTVTVTRRGQTTIPAKFRKKYKIEEGTVMEIQDTGKGLLFKKKVSTVDLIRTGKASQRDIFALLDRMRSENDRWKAPTV